ncbi:MAG: hypothetical protein IPM24_12375 [Bryobacterales bacterium]|nr:hypothetical protein [Bryobacterales bacterium]
MCYSLNVPQPPITARVIESGFAEAHDTYNGLSDASDGRIYYVLCSDRHDVAGRMYRYDPAADSVQFAGDLSEACGEGGQRAVSQGKSHVRFYEMDGKVYFATHIGYYTLIDGRECAGVPPEGWQRYLGGHFLSYDMASGAFEDLALAPGGEGILTMSMDSVRGRLYAITWPTGRFLAFDLASRRLDDLGPISAEGEAGHGSTYRTLCRSLAVDPRDGSVFYSISEGDLFRYSPDTGRIDAFEGVDLRRDYFGQYEIASPGHMAYNWRQTVWRPGEDVFYGVHGNSGYLFRFDPRARSLELVERLTSGPSRRSGMFDQFSYGYLSFTLGHDNRTIHYLTGGPIPGQPRVSKDTAKGEAKGEENLHYVTYDLDASEYCDHGAIFFPDGTRPAYVNSIAVGRDGTVYTLSRVPAGGAVRTDLIAFRRA